MPAIAFVCKVICSLLGSGLVFFFQLSRVVVGAMPYFVLVGLLPSGDLSSLFLLFAAPSKVQAWAAWRGVRCVVALAVLLVRCLIPLTWVDRLQLLIPNFSGGVIFWLSPVLLPSDLRLQPHILRVLRLRRLLGGPPACQSASTLKSLSQLHRDVPHRLVPMWLEASAQEDSAMETAMIPSPDLVELLSLCFSRWRVPSSKDWVVIFTFCNVLFSLLKGSNVMLYLCKDLCANMVAVPVLLEQ